MAVLKIKPLAGDIDILESKVHSWLKKNLEKRYNPAWIYKAPSGRYARKGVPDFLVCIKGRFIAIEVKRVSGNPTPAQIEELRKLNLSGALSIILFGRNPEIFSIIDDYLE